MASLIKLIKSKLYGSLNLPFFLSFFSLLCWTAFFGYYYLKAVSGFNVRNFKIGCYFHPYLTYYLYYASSLHFALIAFDRLLSIAKPFFYREHVSTNIAILMTLFVNTMSLTFAIPTLLLVDFPTVDENLDYINGVNDTRFQNVTIKIHRCSWKREERWFKILKYFKIMDSVIGSILPFIFVLIASIGIFWLSFNRISNSHSISSSTISQNTVEMIPLKQQQTSSPTLVRSRQDLENINNNVNSYSSTGLFRSTLTLFLQGATANRGHFKVAKKVTVMLMVQNIIFLSLTLPLSVYFLLLNSPISRDTSTFLKLHPYVNILQYLVNIIQFPIYFLFNNFFRKKVLQLFENKLTRYLVSKIWQLRKRQPRRKVPSITITKAPPAAMVRHGSTGYIFDNKQFLFPPSQLVQDINVRRHSCP